MISPETGEGRVGVTRLAAGPRRWPPIPTFPRRGEGPGASPRVVCQVLWPDLERQCRALPSRMLPASAGPPRSASLVVNLGALAEPVEDLLLDQAGEPP